MLGQNYLVLILESGSRITIPVCTLGQPCENVHTQLWSVYCLVRR